MRPISGLKGSERGFETPFFLTFGFETFVFPVSIYRIAALAANNYYQGVPFRPIKMLIFAEVNF